MLGWRMVSSRAERGCIDGKGGALCRWLQRVCREICPRDALARPWSNGPAIEGDCCNMAGRGEEGRGGAQGSEERRHEGRDQDYRQHNKGDPHVRHLMGLV